MSEPATFVADQPEKDDDKPESEDVEIEEEEVQLLWKECDLPMDPDLLQKISQPIDVVDKLAEDVEKMKVQDCEATKPTEVESLDKKAVDAIHVLEV